MKRIALMIALTCAAHYGMSQTMTFYHDESKSAQISVMELGQKALTPQYYYQLTHRSYYSNANSADWVKESLRGQAGAASYIQVSPADTIRADLESRAEVEAANVLDRLVDGMWVVEGPKIEGKLKTYRDNILFLTGRAKQQEIDNWVEMGNMYEFAAKAIHEAYLANSERQKMYLGIYSEIVRGNDLLLRRISYLKVKQRADQLNAALSNFSHRAKEEAPAAYNRWREAASGRQKNGSTQVNP